MQSGRFRKPAGPAGLGIVTIAPVTLRPVDLAVIIAYLAGVTWFGARFRKDQRSLKDYFLGGRTAPWWAIGLSIVSAETSTLTIIGTPPLAYAGSYIFLVTRSLAEGVRVFAISIVISIILRTGGIASILAIVALTLFYTFEGGMTAVIWTDVIQMGMYVLGAAVSFFVLLGKIPGGFGHVIEIAGPAGKLRVFDFHWSWTNPYTIWAGIIGGCFLTTASHGTDQLVVQRLLSAGSERESRLALLSSWIVIFVQFSLFLTIGVMLWVYRNGRGFGNLSKDELDRLYPSFIWDSLPVGIA